MRPRLPFLGLALAAVIGVFVADRWELPVMESAAVFGITALLSFLVPRTWLCLLCTCAAFATLHTTGFKHHPHREAGRTLTVGEHPATLRGVVWTEPDPLAYFSGRQTGTFRLKTDDDAFVLITWAGPLPRYGDRVAITGQPTTLPTVRNPGQLDFAALLHRQGVFAQIEAQFPQDCLIEGHDAGNPLVVLSLRTSRWMQEQLKLDLDDSPELATLIASMVLGLRGETPAEVKDMFRTTGTLHLFAVSGLNIAMLAVIAVCVLRPLGFGRRVVAAITIPLLFFYALVTGLSPSCVRAAIMGALVLLGLLFERPPSVYNSLAAAAVLILAWDTNQLFIPGFQFSFVLVFTIVWLASKISRRLEPFGRPDPFLPQPLWSWRQRSLAWGTRLLAASFGVTFAAWLGSLFFMAGYFHIVSPSAILANLIAVPIAFCVLALGIATVLTAAIAKPIAVLFSNANWLCAKALLGTVKIFTLVPAGHMYVELPRLAATPVCEITVLDVGEGAAIHLRSGSADWLVDSGAKWSYDSLTLPYLRSRGINRLDTLLLTHGDAQHIGSASTLFADLTPRLLLDSTVKDRSSTRRSFHAELAAQDRGKAFARRGDEFTLGRSRVQVLFPPRGWQGNLADDKAMVVRIECEGRRVLLMSDAGFITERWLIENEPDLRADVLVKGHHSRDLSGTEDFIGHVTPAVVIAGQLRYGAPSEHLDEWCSTVAERGITVFRQDQCGAARIAIRDGAVAVSGFVNGQTFRSRAR